MERVLRQRAVSVHLHPEIEDVCRLFLHQECVSHVGPGQEIQCLQDNLQKLDEDCQKPCCMPEETSFTGSAG